MTELHVALVSPHYHRSYHGNASSVRRLERGLTRRGVHVSVSALDAIESAEGVDAPSAVEAQALARPLPKRGIVHGLHARRTAPVLDVYREAQHRTVVTLTGTDLNDDMADPQRLKVVVENLRRADAVIAYHPSAREELLRVLPELQGRVHVIPPGVWIPPETWLVPSGGERREFFRQVYGAEVSDEELVCFLPAGIRPVKNVGFAIDPLARLRESGVPVRLVIAGAPMDADEVDRLRSALRRHPWVLYRGPLSPEMMEAAYRVCDVVLNTSRSEGLANTVLEAMARAKPVLASAIDGNRAVITHGEDGLLYRGEEEFVAHVKRLALDPDGRRRLGETARARIRRRFSLRNEVEAHIHLYRGLWEEGGHEPCVVGFGS